MGKASVNAAFDTHSKLELQRGSAHFSTLPYLLSPAPWPLQANRKRIKPTVVDTITLGSDCSRWCAEKLACDMAGIPSKQLCACDSDKNVQQLVAGNF